MAAFDFPNSPSLDDTHTENGVEWKYNGYAWDRVETVAPPGPPGPPGTSVTGPPGPDGTSGARNFNVTAPNASVYTIDGSSNPTLALLRGFTYTFTVNASGHPFWIKTSQTTGTGNQYNTGVTGNGTQSGTITWNVASDAPSTLYYICQYHSAMTGTISISDLGPAGPPGPTCLLYTSPSPRDRTRSRMPSSA